jgi:hypothetical protein
MNKKILFILLALIACFFAATFGGMHDGGAGGFHLVGTAQASNGGPSTFNWQDPGGGGSIYPSYQCTANGWFQVTWTYSGGHRYDWECQWYWIGWYLTRIS